MLPLVSCSELEIGRSSRFSCFGKYYDRLILQRAPGIGGTRLPALASIGQVRRRRRRWIMLIKQPETESGRLLNRVPKKDGRPLVLLMAVAQKR